MLVCGLELAALPIFFPLSVPAQFVLDSNTKGIVLGGLNG